MTEFAIGDVVRLKAGGPEMTITRPLDADGEVCATWDEGNADEGSTYHKPFKPEDLVRVRTADEEFERTIDEITAEPLGTGMSAPNFAEELKKYAGQPEPPTPTNRDNLAGRLFGNKAKPKPET